MNSLYQDAIADARKLREVAEQSAKNKIIDAITPRLRQLIERELNEGDDELVDVEDSELLDIIPDLDALADEELEPSAEPMLPPEPMPMDSDGFSAIEVVDEPEEPSIEDESQNKSVHVNITVEKRNRLLRQRAVRLVKLLGESKTRSQRLKIRRQLKVLREALIITENSQNKRLARNIKVILKESNMSRRRLRNRWLFEGEEEGKDGVGAEAVDFDDADLEGDEGEELESAGGILDALETLGVDIDAVQEELEAEDGEGEEDLELEDEEGEEEDFDLDLEESHGMREGDDKEEEEEEEVVEISESMLRRALRGTSRRTNTRKPRRNRRTVAESRRLRRRRFLRENEAVDAASSFGGGEAGDEMFVDVDENDLLNALGEELGEVQAAPGSAKAPADNFGGGSIKSDAMAEARRRRRNRRSSTRRNNNNRVVETARHRVRTANAKTQAVRKELNESNLFNAKLLYVTKLMQQHTLNKKQQRAIVEAMDNAKTQREAKLLFTSINESLGKRHASKTAAKNGNLTENRSRTGSSSRSLQSSAPANSGSELDRWAVLAGINK